MKNYKFLIMSAAILASSAAMAERVPVQLATDSRMQQVMFAKDQVVPIKGMPFISTHIVFGQDEAIVEVENGDLGAWTASVNPHIPYSLFLKPTAWESHTNLTVITNKHTYYFDLRSPTKENASKTTATYALQMLYPTVSLHTKLLKPQHHKAKPCHRSYSYTGDLTMVPERVYDDGEFTYMKFAPHQTLPAVFAVTSKRGHEAVVNLHRNGQWVVIHRVAPQFTLRHGSDHVASIFNDRVIGGAP